MGLLVLFIILNNDIIGYSSTVTVPTKPTDVKIDVNLKALTVNVSWKVPTTGMKVKYTRIDLKDSERRRVYNDYVDMPTMHYLFQNYIHHCMQYTVSLIFYFERDEYSKRSYHEFDMFGIPSTPHLSVNPSHYFVGDTIKFTCSSSVRRWPDDNQSCLSYTYFGINGTRVGDDLVVTNLQESHMGIEVGCIVNDNYHNMSEYSNTIILSPNYGPDDIKIQPKQTQIDISEGDTLGSYECTADCNPPCDVRWGTNIWGGANITFQTSTLRIPDIARNQQGTYTCDVFHQHDRSRHKYININVKVLSNTTNTEATSNAVRIIPVFGTLSAVTTVLLLIVIIVVIIKFHREKMKNHRNFQQQRSVVQRNREPGDVHFISADLQASESASPGCYLSLRSRDEPHAYDIIRRESQENGERMYVNVE